MFQDTLSNPCPDVKNQDNVLEMCPDVLSVRKKPGQDTKSRTLRDISRT